MLVTILENLILNFPFSIFDPHPLSKNKIYASQLSESIRSNTIILCCLHTSVWYTADAFSFSQFLFE